MLKRLQTQCVAPLYLVEHDRPVSALVTGPQVLSRAGNRKVESSQETVISTKMKVPIWM